MCLRQLGRLPAPCLALAKRLLLFLLYRFPSYRREIVEANLLRAFPETSVAHRAEIARRYYAHLARLAVEVVRTPHMQSTEFTDAISLRNPTVVEAASENFTRTTLFLSIHQGNWEWMLHAISGHFKISVDPIYKPLHSTPADTFMHSVRARFGAVPIRAQDTGAYVLRNRREPRAIAVLADQAPTDSEPKAAVRFFDQDIAFNNGITQLARLTDATVIFVQCHAIDEASYELEFHLIAEGDRDKTEENPQQALLERYATLAEKSIRAQPHTWLWSHNRWKHAGAEE
ncbi:MAG: lysophospholipid acyltransferase family protein [Halioglobus sp.]